MFARAICKLGGHRVNRRRVWHDGVDFRTSCDRCHAPLIRDERSGWREFGDDDALEERQAHPHHAS